MQELESIEGDQIIDNYLTVNAIAAMKKAYRGSTRNFLSRMEKANLVLSDDHKTFLETYPS